MTDMDPRGQIDYTTRELTLILQRLEQKVEDGFQGVHDRQDVANGGAQKREEKIQSLETWRWMTTGSIGVIAIIGLPFIGWVIAQDADIMNAHLGFNIKLTEIMTTLDALNLTKKQL